MRPPLNSLQPSVYGACANALGVFIALSLAGCGEDNIDKIVNRENCATDNENCHDKRCCKKAGEKCFVKNPQWASCRAACAPGSINPKDPKQYRTPWECQELKLDSSSPPLAAVAAVPDGPQPVPAPAPAKPLVAQPAPIAQPASAPPVPLGAPPPQCNSGISKGGISIGGLGAGFLAGDGAGSITSSALTINHEAGFSVLDKCEADWVPDSFKQFHLLGNHIIFTVDLSKVGCACNLAFYFISAAAKDESGAYSAGTECADTSPYYCDANQVCGQWCPEIDIMEANNHVFQSTVHKCDAPNPNGHYSNCDRGGCAGGQNTKTMGANSYGLGAPNTIDTSMPFTVDTYFPENAGTLSGMVSVLRQGTKVLTLDHANCASADPAYFSQLSEAMEKGMSLRITYWGSDAQTMAWMDQPICAAEACDGLNAGPGVISNIRVVGHQEHIATLPPLPSIGPPKTTEAPPPTPSQSSGFSWVAFIFWFLVVGALIAVGVWYYMYTVRAREIKLAQQREAELLRQQLEEEEAERQKHKSVISIFNCTGWPCAPKRSGYSNANAPKPSWLSESQHSTDTER